MLHIPGELCPQLRRSLLSAVMRLGAPSSLSTLAMRVQLLAAFAAPTLA